MLSASIAPAKLHASSGRIASLQIRATMHTSPAVPRVIDDSKPFVPSRRHITIAAIVGGGALLYAQASDAVNAIDAKKRADERKEKLKEAAEKMREKGVSQSAFTDSRYAVSDDKSPNIHSRQEEGSKSQSNV